MCKNLMSSFEMILFRHFMWVINVNKYKFLICDRTIVIDLFEKLNRWIDVDILNYIEIICVFGIVATECKDDFWQVFFENWTKFDNSFENKRYFWIVLLNYGYFNMSEKLF